MILGIDTSQANRKIRSGTEWYAFNLIQEFKKQLGGKAGLEVRLYTREKLQPDLAAGLPANFKVKILRWPLKYFWGQIRLSLEMLAHPPDILFCPAHTIPLVHPKKTFTTLHDVGFKDNPKLYDKMSLWYHRFSAWLAIKTAFHIFTVSEFSKKRILVNYPSEATKISVIYLAYQQSSAENDWHEVLETLGLKEKGYILYVGRIEPKKNVLNMLKGYEMAGIDVPFVLAGKKVQISEVENYLNSKPLLSSKVRFLDYISEEEKQTLYKNASIFLFPTLYEGFGLPILEAQAAGTPVITSNTTSNPEIAGGGAILVDPRKPGEIAKAINELLGNANLRSEKIRVGLEMCAGLVGKILPNKP